MNIAYELSIIHGPELTMDQWDAIKRKPRLHHGDASCHGRQFGGEGCVFFCRGPHGCGRWFCACDGGDGDEHEENLCSACWCKYQDIKVSHVPGLGYMQGKGAA